MSRSERRVERIKEEVDMLQLLEDLGYEVRPDMDREQQFSCDLHGDGHDNTPSARVYPESGDWYCFACSQTRDQIETIRAKQGLGFMESIAWLERSYNLPTMAWEEGDERRRDLTADVMATLRPNRTFEEDRKALDTTLSSFTKERDLNPKMMAALWEALDKVVYLTVDERGKKLSEHQGRLALEKIRQRAAEKYKEWARAQ